MLGPTMRSIRWFIVLNVAALLAVSVWFRCRELGNLPGVNGDEAWYGVQAECVLHGEPITWRTPTGNLLNPLFFGPQLLLHAFFAPSFALLRLTAVASGILALSLNYILCRKVFGSQPAVVSTVILAVLPINIVYSRLAWDSCQSLLVTLPAIYWSSRAIVVPAWRLWFSAAAMVALATSIIVHPTNIFVGPVVGVCLLTAWRDELGFVQRNWKVPALVMTTAVALFAATDHERFEASLGRLTKPAEYAAFATNLRQLFSGQTVYAYVSGATSPSLNEDEVRNLVAYDIAAAAVVVWLAVGLLRWFAGRPRVSADKTDFATTDDDSDRQAHRRLAAKSLLFGWTLSLVAFLAIAGPAAIAAHFERYGICLIGPGAILAALGVCGWLNSPNWLKDISALMALLVGWLLVLTVKANLFDYIHRTGGDSHFTFRTAANEPKEQAYRYICQHADGRVEVRTSQWWLYWPIRYLTFRREDGDRPIVTIAGAERAPSSADDEASVWEVEFVDKFSWRPSIWGDIAPAHFVDDFSGRPTIAIIRIPAPSVHPLRNGVERLNEH